MLLVGWCRRPGSALPAAARLFRTYCTQAQPAAAVPARRADHIRNIAIVAHVDHGKTTLVDVLLRESGNALSAERVMDSNALEKERGITILAKTTSLQWNGVQLNIVDTPGHADFAGEVERTLSMVDGVVLLVDINEGPMAQTKFVTSKAIQAGLKPIVCLNKVDRCDDPATRAEAVFVEMLDLFETMGASDAQLDFPMLYASAKAGWATTDLSAPSTSMHPLLQAVVDHVPPPEIRDGKFQMLVSMMEHNEHFGTVLTGRVLAGEVTPNTKLRSLSMEGAIVEEARVLKVLARRGGMSQKVLDKGLAGDIVTIAGFPNSRVTNTLCDISITEPLQAIPIDPPTISMTFGPNTSPLAGREGTNLTASVIGSRLAREAASNVSIVVRRSAGDDAYEVCGRGPLQLGILLENMRREGFELSVSSPEVLFKKGPNGELLEPIEELTMEVDDQDSGYVIEEAAQRKGEMLDFTQARGRSTLKYLIPARGLLGFQNLFILHTRGSGIMHHLFHSHQPHKGEITSSRKGVLVSMDSGVTTSYALNLLEPRGVLFIGEGLDVYPGMIVGEHSKSNDLDVNPTRTKKLTNIRAAGSDEKVRLAPPRLMTLEDAIAYVQNDELIEVTPQHIRLRKKLLDSRKRRAATR